jgi:GTP-binding protein YchF
MSLKCGIVGLPNVGKSTLFNALGNAKAEAANYPFCTIEPNVGVVNVPDEKLHKIASLVRTLKVVSATTQIVDIAGIVKGASKKVGLGNHFLHHIREVDAILHLVRCFVNDDIIHVDGSVDPNRDIEVIETELLLADLQTLDKRVDNERRVAKVGDKEAQKNLEIFEGLQKHMNEGKPARSFPLEEADRERVRPLCLLTYKPVLYVCNTTGKPEEKLFVEAVQKIAAVEGAKVVSIDCELEAQIAQFPEEERSAFLDGMGPGLNRLVKAAFDLLGLTTYYSAVVIEARAWTITQGMKAPQAAGVIHSDFEKGFICAEVFRADDLIRLGSEAKVKEGGLMRLEGKEYVVQPEDVMNFRFNV